MYTSIPRTVTDGGLEVVTTSITETDPGSVMAVLNAECASGCGTPATLVCDTNTDTTGTFRGTITATSGEKVQLFLLGWVNTGEEANITCQSGIGETWTVTARMTVTSTATLHGVI